MGTLGFVVIAAVAVACAFWIAGSFAGLATARRIRRVDDLSAPEPARWPAVSIIVPARDEADTLREATRAKLTTEYPDTELVLVDDRSADGTGAIMDEIAREDGRARVVHLDTLPDGWLGKVHALARGVDEARGAWLLFTDADVHLSRDVLTRVVAWAEARGLDHVAAMPEVHSRGFLLDAAYATFGRYFALSQRIWAIEDPRSSASIGVGAFNLVRREALERAGGFEALKMEVADDLALGIALKRSGARPAVVNGAGHVTLVWYESLLGMIRGLEKNTFAILGCSLPRALFAAATTLFIDLAPLATFVPAAPAWLRALAAAALIAGMIAAAVTARWVRRPVLPALLFPIGGAILAFILVRAGVLGAWRGGISWRGTFHSSAELRRGMRLTGGRIR